MRHLLLCSWFAVLLVTACDESHDAEYDLPHGWENARPIHELTQAACSGSPYLGPPESLTWSAQAGQLELAYHHAHFRCQQDVEAFVRQRAMALDVLVQPIDMHPTTIAKCDCAYEVMIRLSPEPGTYRLTLYRRWDALSEANPTVEVASETVEIP